MKALWATLLRKQGYAVQRSLLGTPHCDLLRQAASPALLGDKKRVAEHADTDDHGDDSHDALERAVAAIRAADAQRARRLTREKGP